MRKIFICIFLVLWTTSIFCQVQLSDFELQAGLNQLVISQTIASNEVQNFKITDQYQDSKSGLQRVYLQQTIDEIPIDGAISSFYGLPGEPLVCHRPVMYYAPSKNISNGSIAISPNKAIVSSAIDLGYNTSTQLRSIIASRTPNVYTSTFFDGDIIVHPIYAPSTDGFILCYSVTFKELNHHGWRYLIDGKSGAIRDKFDFTIYCHAATGLHIDPQYSAEDLVIKTNNYPLNDSFADDATYQVYPLPAISPVDGAYEIVQNPAIEEASPFGWHDTDGIMGPEFTITRGNNVHAYADIDGNNSQGIPEPEGGQQLSFIFPHNLNEEPISSSSASVTNLFYTSNMAHDLSYLIGFREESGNYQQNNYGNDGLEGDAVLVESLDGAGNNNANFSVTPDGSRGRMQMFQFDKVTSLLSIEEPMTLSEREFESAQAAFGNRIESSEISAEIAVAETNGSENTLLGCEAIVSDVQGKIAMINRGVCDFSQKVFRAQQAGAVMAIICNVPGVNGGDGEDVFVMQAGDFGNQVTIPSVMMKKSDCDLIRVSIASGERVVGLAKDRPIEGPRRFDSSFDNGIVLHEYGHGISTRLTGGPGASACLRNFRNNDGSDNRGEQMGEGWSDFFALIWTTKVGDSGEMGKGMGTYVIDEDLSGKGIRSFPYSTDLNINPLTYDDIKVASVPHGVGTVWASMLWDMYWAFIDMYGFNADWRVETSGNHRAAALVLEGLKLQPCQPGFVDGRDAILEADRLLYNGDHQALIWGVFARRGLGFGAQQGSSSEHRDGDEDFSLPPLLVEELKATLVANNNVRPGDLVDASLDYVNHIPSTQTDVNVSIDLPDGLTYVPGSSEIEPSISNSTLVFEVGSLAYQEKGRITFNLLASQDLSSTRLYYDDVEASSTEWQAINLTGQNTWERSNESSLSGNFSWFSPELGSAENLQMLLSPPLTVLGARPVFRFWHQYAIREAINGAFIELSEDSGDSWQKINQQLIIRNEYNGGLSFLAFGIPDLAGFSGESGDQYIDSYIDLTPWKGMNVQLRFRFGQQAGFSPSSGQAGWSLDDFELLDLETYQIQPCISSQETGDSPCGNLREIVVNTATRTSTPGEKAHSIDIFPSLTQNVFQVNLSGINGDVELELWDMAGKKHIHTQIVAQGGIHQVEVQHLASGMYLVVVNHEKGRQVEKIQIMR